MPNQVEKRNGQKVDPAALAAFYRHRSESLRDAHTVARQGPDGSQAIQATQQANQKKKLRPVEGILDYVLSAFQGHPGFLEP